MVALSWACRDSEPESICEGEGCGCQASDECVLTPYKGPVMDVDGCYCTDVSCGSAVPRATAAAEEAEAQWISFCAELPASALCSGTPHCFLHPPEHVECVDGRCAKFIDD
jgi:hypothetical protein